MSLAVVYGKRVSPFRSTDSSEHEAVSELEDWADARRRRTKSLLAD
ncbi:MAG TPA: hypothetical protein VI818_01090 [Candidatus Thermoplasmatota archaeon]|nr:hypothetical protein [Candidatus Thermoplasmatota archaeon]